MKKEDKQMKHELSKTVEVSDSYRWYNENKLEVRMYRLRANKSIVRIMFFSIDDALVYRDFDEWDFEGNWKWCKEWLWDRMPEVVNMEWMYEHGYVKF